MSTVKPAAGPIQRLGVPTNRPVAAATEATPSLRSAPDRVELSSAANQGLATWLEETSATVSTATVTGLKAIASDALTRLNDPGLTNDDKASLYLLASQAHGRLSDLEDQTGNGKKAYSEVSTAAGLAPRRAEIVTSYAAAVNELVTRGFTRPFAESVLGVKTTDEAKRALVMLGNFPNNAAAQLYRIQFAKSVDDQATVDDAQSRLASLPKAAVAAAAKDTGIAP